MNLYETAQGIGVGALFSLIALYVGWRIGFFRKQNWSRYGPSEVKIFHVLIAFAVFFVLQLVVFPLILHLALRIVQAPIGREFQSWAILGIICLSTSIIFAFTYRNEPVCSSIWNSGNKSLNEKSLVFCKGGLTWFLGYPLVYLTANLGAFLIIYLYGEFPLDIEQSPIRYIKSFTPNSAIFWANAVVIALVVPLAEELLFRGYLQSWFRSWLPSLPAILLTSLLFSLAHFTDDQSIVNWQIIPSLFVLSCLLGFLYEKYQTLWASIGLHVTFNAVSIVIIYSSF